MNDNFNIANKELIALIAKGDEKAFNILFESYRNQLYNYLLKTTKSKEIAEEATLDVFLKIWNSRVVLTEIVNFEAFIFRVVQNKAIDYIRKAKSNRSSQLDIWTDIENLSSTETADQKILKADTEFAIKKAINKLPEQRKEAFRLSREEYLSYDEIAERMKISRNTVRNHVTTALSYLRDHLENGSEITTIILLTIKCQ